MPSAGGKLPVVSPGGGDVRVGPIIALPGLLDEVGACARAVFAEARVDPRTFDNAENRLSYAGLGRVLVTGAKRSGCDHLGLLLGDRFTLAGFGLLGELMRNAPTVGEALRLLVLHLYLHDRIAVPFLLPASEGRDVDLGYSIKELGAQPTRIVYDAAIAIGNRILRELCGAAWRPTQVNLPERPPRDRMPYQRVYRAPVYFDAELASVRIDVRCLAQAIPGADPARYAACARALEAQRVAQAPRFADEVLCALHRLVLMGTPASKDVSRLFGISERTMRDRLRADDTSYGELLRETRQILAQQLIHNTRLPLSEVAAALGYADLASFSRAFRAWTAQSPSRWRGKPI